MHTTLYYHLYPGKFLSETLECHADILVNSCFDEIIIEAYNINDKEHKFVSKFTDALSKFGAVRLHLNSNLKSVNEFATLEILQQSLCFRETSDWVAYAHTKGVTHPRESAVVAKGKLLMMNLSVLSCIVKNKKYKWFSDCYNVAGSDLAVANHFSFGPANLAYAGNIWIAKVDYLMSLPAILKYAKLSVGARYYAEAWIGQSKTLIPFNCYSPHRYHYDDHSLDVDYQLINKEIINFLDNPDILIDLQLYHDKIINYYKAKIDSILDRIYPRSILIRRRFQKAIFELLGNNILLFKIFSSISYRLKIAHSKFGLYYMDIPSQIEIYRYIKKKNINY